MPSIPGKNIIKKTLKTVIPIAGIYKMKSHTEIMYIGKAKNLQKRLSQYINTDKLPYRLQRMVAQITDIEVLYTKSENEALALEANLIKNIKPKFNIALKDDKSPVYLCITTQHNFPRIFKFRGKKTTNAKYYGPYLSTEKLNQTIVELQKLFLLRNCNDQYFRSRKRPCLLYEIKRCSAPCVGKITESAYQEKLASAKLLLAGKYNRVDSDYRSKMEYYSKNEQYEEAAIFRDKIRLLNYSRSKNIFYDLLDNILDIFIIVTDAKKHRFAIQSFTIRNGRDFGGDLEIFDMHPDFCPKEQLLKYLHIFYNQHSIPTEILANISVTYPSNQPRLKEPKYGRKKEILDFVLKNVTTHFTNSLNFSAKKQEILSDVSKIFNLEQIPNRIDVIDNSHNSGSTPISAVIVYEEQKFVKKDYRYYKIKEPDISQDDCAMMSSVIQRHYKKLPMEKLPDLLIIDGGKGQLNAVLNTLQTAQIGCIEIVAMAKDKNRKPGLETFFKKNSSPIKIPQNSPAMNFLVNLRDEAHRFVISAHRKAALKRNAVSQLDDIPGIGPSRKKDLLLYFGSLNNIKMASQQDISKVKGINQRLAKVIFQYINNL